MKNKHKLVRKIFIAVVSIFIVILLLQLFIQQFILQDWYYYAKDRQMEKIFSTFVEEIEEEAMDVHRLSLASEAFMKRNEQPLLLFKSNGEILNQTYFDQFSSIKVKDHEREYLINMDNFTDEESQFVQGLTDIKLGKTVKISFVKIPGVQVYNPIDFNGRIGNQQGFYSFERESDQVIHIEGEIVEISLVPRPSGIGRYQGSKLIGEMYHLQNGLLKGNLLSEKETHSYSFVEEYSGLHMVVYLSEVYIHGEAIYCLSLITLENIEDTFDVLGGYYFYMFLIQCFFAVGLIVIFIRWISKPIIEINHAAGAIANHDFSRRASVKSNDELQTLSESINRISDNLSTTIDALEISNMKLRDEVQKRTDNEDRMRNMLSGLSHEFKTPLGIISGFTEIIKADVGDKEPAYYLNSIEEEVDRLNEMVMETLELTKLETGIYKIKEEMFDIHDVIQRVIASHKNLAEEKNQTILYQGSEHIVMGDQKKISQVLSNLITNGIRYSPQSAHIRISLVTVDDKAYIHAMNSGVQIHKEDLEFIWNRFYRGDKSRNKSLGGHGLGLAIVYNILELHHSEFDIKNVDEGVEVFFSLKRHKTEKSDI